MKYSIIIPVYNAEKHLKKCLDSVLKQTYDDYEVVIVNDGSTDNSENIIKDYLKDFENKIKYFYKDNTGVSDTRNFGISKASGEYFTFVDSDDYIEPNMLENISKYDNYDILSFNLIEVNQNYEEIKKIIKPSFDMTNGQDGIIKFIESKNYFDTPVSYVYKKKFWDEYNFKYEIGKYHEDFGLTPLVIIRSKQIISIDYFGYYYVQSDNSITRNNNSEKGRKKAYDMLYHFDKLYNVVNNDSNISNKTKKVFNSYIANAVIAKAKTLDSMFLNDYIFELKKRNVKKLVLSNDIRRKIKKIILNVSIKTYIKLFC